MIEKPLSQKQQKFNLWTKEHETRPVSPNIQKMQGNPLIVSAKYDNKVTTCQKEGQIFDLLDRLRQLQVIASLPQSYLTHPKKPAIDKHWGFTHRKPPSTRFQIWFKRKQIGISESSNFLTKFFTSSPSRTTKVNWAQATVQGNWDELSILKQPNHY